MVRQSEPGVIEQLLQEFISIEQRNVEGKFKQGQIAYYLLESGYTNDTLSAEVNCSPEQIRVLVKTFQAFPTEEERIYHEQYYYHYRLAAMTDKPHEWMALASENSWSSRQMNEAIKAVQSDKEPDVDQYNEADRLVYRVEKMIEEDEKLGAYLVEKLAKIISTYTYRNEPWNPYPNQNINELNGPRNSTIKH